MFQGRGVGFRRLAESTASSVAGDTIFGISLAGSLFFTVPSAEARSQVALYLVVTLTPFAIIGPFLGRVFEKFPRAYRGGLIWSAALRAVVAVASVAWFDTVALFPLAFLLLVLSRFHGIAKSSLLPSVLEGPPELIAGNANLARASVLASTVAALVGGLGLWLVGQWVALILAALVFLYSAMSARSLPPLNLDGGSVGVSRSIMRPPRSVRLTRFATGGVRFINGYLLLLVAFAFKDVDAAVVEFSAILAAGGLGFFLAAFLTPVLDRYVSEEPMVVIGLAVEAGAAFIAAQKFGLPAAGALAFAAGLAWGTAKFGFDGLLQSTMSIEARGRAFTNSETFFQMAWVVGALIPVLPDIPTGLGLSLAGVAALVIQVIYVSALLIPVAAERNRIPEPEVASSPPNVMDFL